MATLSVIRRWALREQMRYAKRASSSKLDPYAEKLATWLAIEATKSRKQRRNLRQIHTAASTGRAEALDEDSHCVQYNGVNHLHHIWNSSMTDSGLPTNDTNSAHSAPTDPAVAVSAAQPPAAPTTPVAAQLASNSPAAVPVARKRPALKKAPVNKTEAAATKKAAAKKVSPRKATPAKPVVTKPSAKKGPVTEKAALAKVGAKTVSSKKMTSTKKASAKKTVAKKTVPLKAKPVKAVLAPSQVGRPTAPRTEPATSLQAAESVRDAAKTKAKLVRDSFTMPQQDFGLIAVLKDRALGFKRPAKKSELLRAGLHALQQLTDIQLRGALDSLAPLKAGRPKK
ncbi:MULTISPECIES: hypothetical protein [unclassified Variovorax]|uniref:hypothetical protein n=1 Tax=unclassified Variovorax TaxID=663243 RepID=UPI003F4735DF